MPTSYSQSRVRALFRCVMLSVLVGLPCIAPATVVTNIYYTGFEQSEPHGGYNPTYEFVGQQGWLRYPAVFGGNGLITNFMGSQAAYIGLWPLEPRTNHLSIYRRVDYVPPSNVRSLVKFSVDMDIEDSSDDNGRYDQFWWTLYNAWGDPLFLLNFDNDTWNIEYALEAGDFINTGLKFSNGTVYRLLVDMDFQSNRWSASLSNEFGIAVLATNQPITTTNTPINFGSMDVTWKPKDPLQPGDNFLIMDNYRVVAELDDPTPARLLVFDKPSGGNLALRLLGPEGKRFAIDVSSNYQNWTPLKTNLISGGSFDFVDQNLTSMSPRLFRARLVE